MPEKPNHKKLYYSAIVLSTLLLSFSCKKNPNPIKNQKPNIIFLLTDDQRWDALGASGNPIIQTPNIDALARSGVHMENAYVTTSICAVSRASILSGQYSLMHGIQDFYTSFSQEALNQTYPLLLKQNGYKIGFIGKYGVGNPKDQPKKSFDFWAVEEKHQPNYENKDEKGNYLHHTQMVANHIDRFLNSTKGDEPFCLSVSFKAPHAEDGDPRQFIPDPKFDSLYNDITIKKPETAQSQYWDSFPDFFRTEKNIARIRWKLRFETEEKYQESVKNYYRLISGVDQVIGDLRAKLEQMGIADNTILIFTSDNGMYLGEHGLAGKWYGHQESIRVPMIFHDPRNKMENLRKHSKDIVLNIDIAPTILGFAGVQAPKQMQGADLNSDKFNSSERTTFFYEHSVFQSPELPNVEGVVSKDFSYMNFTEHNYETLYDLKLDPFETKNLTEDSNYKTILTEQRRIYNRLKNEAKQTTP